MQISFLCSITDIDSNKVFKIKAEENPNTRQSKLISPEAETYDKVDNNDVRNLRNIYNYHTSKSKPKLPKSRAETIQNLKNVDTQFKVAVDEAKDNEIAVLTTEENLRVMYQSHLC